MDNFRKLANGAVRSGMLGVGVLGLYLSHKKRIPEYMGFVSYCMTCVSLYALSTYILESEYEETEDKDQVNAGCTTETIPKDLKPSTEKNMAETPKSKKEWGIARRIFLKEFKEETDKVLAKFREMEEPDTGKMESKNIEGIFIKLSDLALINQNAPDEVSELLKKVCDKLDGIDAEEEDITIRTSPMKLEMLDIKIQNPLIEGSETALTEYVKDIIHELQVGEISLLIDTDRKQ